ncbi:hypothetical protein [Filimonas effusa]|uniref:Lipocalin-like domain-containing protein n=1 Tax=Filimonas effusa TaxID=2508721 RepID=A0A4V1MAF8_9BACT|nr:hypothetical protein [Filimonas effusa]RXK85726.1 hypothetical protein ESB13_02605 [Filimonas effusa]
MVSKGGAVMPMPEEGEIVGMRYTSLFLTGLLICFFAACKKDSSDYGNSILGNWKYESSSLDSKDVFTGKWKNLFKGHDDAIASGFAESLFFRAKDTVVYKFSGITAWNKYKIFRK